MSHFYETGCDKMSTPVRLNKVKENNTSFNNLVLDWVMDHPNVIFMLLFIGLAASFAILFNILYDMCTIESGVMRNFLAGGV